MSNAALIEEAAGMIAEFSPATAAAFRAKPFHRLALAEAFDAGFKVHSRYSLLVVMFVIKVAQADKLDRAIAAQGDKDA